MNSALTGSPSRPLPPRSPGADLRQRADQESTQPTSDRAKKRVQWSLLPWKLEPLEIPAATFTRPPRCLLATWDIRLRRYTSPSYPGTVPALLTPPALTPPRSGAKKGGRQERATQTDRRSLVHRGTQQHQPQTRERATQSSDSDWEATTKTTATQTEAIQHRASTRLRRAASTPAKPRVSSEHGSLKWTKTTPQISWRENLATRRSR